MSAGFIIEEGFPLADLERIVMSMKEAAEGFRRLSSPVTRRWSRRGGATASTSSTTGVGLVPRGIELSPAKIRPGDAVLINGPVGSHEAAILSARNDFSLGVAVRSDCAPLFRLMEAVLREVPEARCARDPTRGGVAAALTEIVEAAGYGIELVEDEIPVEEPVRNLCELLGLDPLLMANEGKMLVIVPGEKADACLKAMKGAPEGADARVIGSVNDRKPRLTVKTPYGTTRIVTIPSGSQLPRIC